jgi:hypothetical protein
MPFRCRILLILLAFTVLTGLTSARAADPVLGYLNSWPAMDGYPYYGQNVAFNWIDLTSGGTPLTFVSEDAYVGPYPVGFSFPFYTQSFSEFYINANGFITFEARDPNLDPSMYAVNHCPLPHADKPNNLIAMLWGDLEPKDERGPYIYYRSFPSCPVGSGRCLVVSFIDWRFAQSKELAGTFQAVLYENGEIRLQYLNVGSTVGATSNNSYTVGIENADAGLKYGLVYSCDAPSRLTGGLALKFTRNFLSLSPETTVLKSCNAQAVDYAYSLTNYSGAPGTFTVNCSTSVPGVSLTINQAACPVSLFLTNGQTVSLTATMTPPACSPPGVPILGTLSVAGNGYSATASLQQTLYQSGIWDQIPPEPEYCRQDIVAGSYGGKVWSIAGKGDSTVRTYDPALRQWAVVPAITNDGGLNLDNYARSGCQHGSKIFFYGDRATPGFDGLWSFDMAASPPAVKFESSGGPYPGVFAPAWAYDPEAGLCYLTGGGESPDPPNQNTRSTVYVYDPKNNSWPSRLPNFSTTRKLHAAFIFTSPGNKHKLLCVAGGISTYFSSDTPLSSTQCYDLTAGNALQAENAALGPLPATRWGMGYAQRLHGGTYPQLWLMAGVLPNGQVSKSTLFYDVNGGGWREGGDLISGVAYRNSAVTLNNDEIIKLGGLVELSQVCSADRYQVCSGCLWWTDQVFLPLMLK